jgi:hypothetical protein
MTADGLQFRKASGLAAGKTSAARPELQLNPAALEREAEDGGAVGAGAAKFRRGADGRGNFFATDLAESEALEEWSRGGRQENDFGDPVAPGLLQGLLHEAAAESATALGRLESHGSQQGV